MFYNEVASFLLNLDLTRNIEVKMKSDESLVSDTDWKINNFIEKCAKKNLPSFQIISEETLQNTAGEHSNLIILDPLDGTENFVNGIPIWGVGISIFINGYIDSGIIFFPEIKIYDHSKNINLNLISGFRKIYSSSFKTRIHALSSGKQDIHLNITESAQYRIFGSSLFNLALTANFAIQYTPNPIGAWIWDVAPGLLMCKERGLDVFVNGKLYDGRILNPFIRHIIEIR
jgi:myo-inositol-1(or 4)-monophosphatase